MTDTLKLNPLNMQTEMERFLLAYNEAMKSYAMNRDDSAYHYAQTILDAFLRRYASLPPMTHEIVRAYDAVVAADDIDTPGLSEGEYLALRDAVGQAIKNGRK
jgi:hypothetical protein